MLSVPFNVIHVDAHSDLGSGANRSAIFYQVEVLSREVPDRVDLPIGIKHVNSGKYLVTVIANRWVRSLAYVYPTDPKPKPAPYRSPGITPTELRHLFEHDPEYAVRIINDIGMTTADVSRMLSDEADEQFVSPPVQDLPGWLFADGEDWRSNRITLQRFTMDEIKQPGNRQPLHVEPSVPFQLIPGNDFRCEGVTHLFLARSHGYCPRDADDALPVIREYFN